MALTVRGLNNPQHLHRQQPRYAEQTTTTRQNYFRVFDARHIGAAFEAAPDGSKPFSIETPFFSDERYLILARRY